MRLSEFPHGEPLQVSPGVLRVTAPNPSVFTGPGTNSYVLGDSRAVTLIDPGPAIDSHLQALLDAAPGPVRHIVVTHTHPDHSPGVAPLAKQLPDAEIWGMHPTTSIQDKTFKPTHELRHGDLIGEGDDLIEAIHTPGHASNHFCLLHRRHRMLFTGDHIMEGSTVVIGPPDGDMDAYITSLQELQELDLNELAPAHGGIIEDPQLAIKQLIRHRLHRESKALRALRLQVAGNLDQLVQLVYDDVNPMLHPIAKSSLLAHLLRLEKLGQARSLGGRGDGKGGVWRSL